MTASTQGDNEPTKESLMKMAKGTLIDLIIRERERIHRDLHERKLHDLRSVSSPEAFFYGLLAGLLLAGSFLIIY